MLMPTITILGVSRFYAVALSGSSGMSARADLGMHADICQSADSRVHGLAIGALIDSNLASQALVKFKAATRQRIERGAGTPVEDEQSARLAGCGGRHLGPFDDEDVDPAAREEVGGAGPDHATSANDDPHDVSID
jgi:hypothetical protein